VKKKYQGLFTESSSSYTTPVVSSTSFSERR
jgi:hypothetical protein